MLDKQFKEEEIKLLFNSLDKDKSGEIDLSELKPALEVIQEKKV